ncbi:MAG: NnrS family protein [Steroidobacteraceae bacterium]
MSTLARAPVFSYGFRPFFLLAGIFAAVAIPTWILILRADLAPLGDLPPQLWHGHEMLFGFVAAAIGGFLLTAVPSWTGSRGFAGRPLIFATLAWLLGRLAFAGASWLPLPVVAVAELLFLPVIATLIAPPILRERNRNAAMLLVLTLLWLTDAVFLLAMHWRNPLLASQALTVAINVVLLLVTIIGGRIVPAFTANALRQLSQPVSIRSYAWLERLLPATMLAIVLIDVLAPGGIVALTVAAAAAVLHALRLSGWRSLRVTGRPILWVLHLAYAWLPIGLALKAANLWSGAAWSQWWQHAFGIGVFALMILAVTTRATLGHTGRPLVVRPAIAVAYLLIAAAAVTRIVGPSLWPAHYATTLDAAAALWTTAFLLYLAIYGPMFWRPRVDGKPG